MKKLLLVAVVSVFALTAQAQLEEKNTVDVTGNYLMQVQPDRIPVNITIDENETKGKTQVEQAEATMMKTLKDMGIDTKKDLKLTSSQTAINKKNMLATRRYVLTTYDGETAIAVVAALEKVGVTNVRIGRPTHSQMPQLQAEARKNAMLDAQTKARELSEAVGQSIGKVIFIRDNSYTDYGLPAYDEGVRPIMYRVSAPNGGSSDDTPVEYRPIQIQYNVFVKFELK